jgi:hypothetical protein
LYLCTGLLRLAAARFSDSTVSQLSASCFLLGRKSPERAFFLDAPETVSSLILRTIRTIEDLESRILMTITYHWVEGHQDKTKAVGDLPWPAQLNDRANELATEARDRNGTTSMVRTGRQYAGISSSSSSSGRHR